MPHIFPSGLQDLIATGWYKVYPAVIIAAGDGITTLKYSTINISVGEETFTDNLKLAGAARSSLTRAADKVELQLWNADSQVGLALIDPVEALDGARASYYRIYRDINDAANSYLVEELSGVLVVDPGAGAQDDIVSLTLVSDTAALPSMIGNLPILPTCVYRYKDEDCTYAGDLPTCDLTYDGANGCRAHFTEEEALARFGGHSRDLDPGTFEQYGGGVSDPIPSDPFPNPDFPPDRYPYFAY